MSGCEYLTLVGLLAVLPQHNVIVIEVVCHYNKPQAASFKL